MPLPAPEFKLMLYGPELPAAGLRARAHFKDGILVVHGRHHWYTIPAGDLDLKVGGFDGRQWLVTWASRAGQYTGILQDEGAMHVFVDQAPEGMAQRLHLARRKHTRTGRNFRLAMALAGVLLFLPLFSLAWFWLNADRFSRWAADQVSVAQEIKLGDMAFAQLRDKYQFLPEQALAEQVVDRIGVRLSAGSQYPYRFDVVKDARVNAFALPGGHVVVFTGLLKAADNADEVAGVLAHEISHVEKRHALRSMIHSLGLRAVMAAAMGDFAGGVWSGMADQLASLSYSRDLEREADLEGLKLLRKSGLPAEGMADFFEKMVDREQGNIALLASHPASDERLAALRSAIAAEGPYLQQSLDIDWGAVQRSLDADT